MTATRITDFRSWANAMERRVLHLERRRTTAGDSTGGGAAVAVQRSVSFVGGAASTPLPSGASSATIVSASFSQPVGVGIDSRISGLNVEMYASVSNGSYLVNLIFV